MKNWRCLGNVAFNLNCCQQSREARAWKGHWFSYGELSVDRGRLTIGTHKMLMGGHADIY